MELNQRTSSPMSKPTHQNNQTWRYKGHKITTANKHGLYRVYGHDGKRWLGRYSWHATLKRITESIRKEALK